MFERPPLGSVKSPRPAVAAGATNPAVTNPDAPGVQSWTPGLNVTVASTAANLFAPLAAPAANLDWHGDSLRAPQPRLTSARFRGGQVETVSLPMTLVKLQVSSFQFPQMSGWRKPAADARIADANPPDAVAPAVALLPANGEPPSADKPLARTRIKPPGDVIKLEDRLFYVLQPSLETLMGGHRLVDLPQGEVLPRIC